ncbi:MAG: hypothetical protein JNM28_12390 [Armatimonadetes bacterium]|nr:hypothetical protein [Armatimonadota bacterium]MBS1710216.1 hypothetical protein [Armatimonadota bacterium]MBX3110106.1 hypothetical protein [Fimbriimonadaceae bacterium]
MSNDVTGMRDEERPVVVNLSIDEAYEILNRCLGSAGDDTPLFRDALRRFAWAIERSNQVDEEAA